MLAQDSQSIYRIDGAERYRIILRTSSKNLVCEPVNMVGLVRGVMIPAVLQLDGHNADVPNTGLPVNVGRGEVIAVRIPSETSDLAFMAIAGTLKLSIAYERPCDVVLVNWKINHYQ